MFDLKTDSSIQVILIVVLFGIGTDYILFFLFRYRERLRLGSESRQAVAEAVERAGEAIASAGGAVIVSFMALILSRWASSKSIGPPALAIARGRHRPCGADAGGPPWWPCWAHGSSGRPRAWKKEPESARFAAIGKALGADVRPSSSSAPELLLAVLALFAFGFNPTFDLGDSGAPKDVESSVALQTLQKGLPAGATDPDLWVLLTSTDQVGGSRSTRPPRRRTPRSRPRARRASPRSRRRE